MSDTDRKSTISILWKCQPFCIKNQNGPTKNVIKNGQDKTTNLPNLAKCEPEECCVAIFQAQNWEVHWRSEALKRPHHEHIWQVSMNLQDGRHNFNVFDGIIIFNISIGVKCFFLETIFLAEKVTIWRGPRQIFGNKEMKER